MRILQTIWKSENLRTVGESSGIKWFSVQSITSGADLLIQGLTRKPSPMLQPSKCNRWFTPPSLPICAWPILRYVNTASKLGSIDRFVSRGEYRKEPYVCPQHCLTKGIFSPGFQFNAVHNANIANLFFLNS